MSTLIDMANDLDEIFKRATEETEKLCEQITPTISQIVLLRHKIEVEKKYKIYSPARAEESTKLFKVFSSEIDKILGLEPYKK